MANESRAKHTSTWLCGFGAGSGETTLPTLLKQQPGRISYRDIAYVKSLTLQNALIQNKARNFVDATGANVTAAVEAVAQRGLPEDLLYSITDPLGANSYPMGMTDWALVYGDQSDSNRGRVRAYFLWWATHERQQYAEALCCVSLPRSIVRRDEEQRSVSFAEIPLHNMLITP